METIELVRKDLKYTFGFEPVTQGNLEFHLQKPLDKLKRLTFLMISGLAIAGISIWLLTGSNVTSVLLLLACFVGLRFTVIRSEIKSCSRIVPVDDLPDWLLRAFASDNAMREDIVGLARRQGGLFQWQIIAFKTWRSDKGKKDLKLEISRDCTA